VIIYKVTNKVNGKIYIGKTVKSLPIRKSQHCYTARSNRSASYFHKAIRKNGQDSFDWQVLESCKNTDELSKREMYWIKVLKTNVSSKEYKGSGYN
jgi:group I intron endonuclease